MDSAAAIDRIRSDTLGPVQRFAAASIEVCSRTLGRKKRRHGPLGAATPGHRGQRGGGQICQCRGRGGSPADAVPNDYRWEHSLSYMTRAFAETKNRTTAQWIADHVKPERKYSPPPGKDVRRKQLRRARKSVSGRYFQLMSGHAAIGPYLKDKIKKPDDDKCWWCGGRKQQARHHLFTECRAWRPQIRRLNISRIRVLSRGYLPRV